MPKFYYERSPMNPQTIYDAFHNIQSIRIGYVQRDLRMPPKQRWKAWEWPSRVHGRIEAYGATRDEAVAKLVEIIEKARAQ